MLHRKSFAIAMPFTLVSLDASLAPLLRPLLPPLPPVWLEMGFRRRRRRELFYVLSSSALFEGGGGGDSPHAAAAAAAAVCLLAAALVPAEWRCGRASSLAANPFCPTATSEAIQFDQPEWDLSDSSYLWGNYGMLSENHRKIRSISQLWPKI